MNELSEDFIRDYCLYLRNEVGLAQSSVWIYSIPLKHIVTTAHYNGKMARNPFAQYKVDPDHKERGFLTEDELQAFTTVELNNPDLELARDHEWVKMFHSNIDRLLVSIEKLFESRQPGAFNDELLTDKEVAHILKVSRRTLQDYRNNGILSYIQVGGKILYRTSDVQRTIMSGFKEVYSLKDT